MNSGRPAPHLLASDLCVGYGGQPVVQGICLSVGKGEVVALIGPNGAGKSTALKGLAGELPVLSGQITLGGVDVANLPSELMARKGVGYVPQFRDVFEGLTVRENLEIGGYLLKRRQLAQRMAETLSLFPSVIPLLKRRTEQLSGGERKIVAIAKVMMAQPELILLDEPTASLSPKVAAAILQEHVRGLADKGTAVLVVEQRVVAVLEVADWVYLVVAGACVAQGEPRTLHEDPRFGEVFLGADPTTQADPNAQDSHLEGRT